jgi:hypothetical protein
MQLLTYITVYAHFFSFIVFVFTLHDSTTVGHLQVFPLYSSTTALHVHSPLLVQSRLQYMSMQLLMFSILALFWSTCHILLKYYKTIYTYINKTDIKFVSLF